MTGGIFILQRQLKLDSRTGMQIENHSNMSPLLAGALAYCEHIKKKYPNAKPRPTKPTAGYNCHGLTFASRRTGITKPAIIRDILDQDGYIRVQDGHIASGDTVVYIERGDISHSGVVVHIEEILGIKRPWVLSKWGDAAEFIHSVGDCPYPADQIEYYRIET